MKSTLLMMIYLFFCTQLIAQNQAEIDNLRKKISKKLPDSTQSILLAQLSEAYHKHQPDTARKFAKEGWTLAKKIKHPKGMAANLKSWSLIEWAQDNDVTALRLSLQALAIFESLRNVSEIAILSYQIGSMYQSQSKYKDALKYYQQALNAKQNHKDQTQTALILNDIGESYFLQQKYTDALQYFSKSLTVCEKLKDLKLIFIPMNQIGEVYEKQDSNAQARQYFDKSLLIGDSLKDKQYQSMALCNLAKLSLKERRWDMEGVQKALELAESIGAKKESKNALEILIRIYEEQGNHLQAYESYKLFTRYKDSLNEEAVHKQIKSLQYDLQFTKEQQENLSSENNYLVHGQSPSSNQLYWIILGIGSLLLAWMWYQLKYYKQKNKYLEGKTRQNF